MSKKKYKVRPETSIYVDVYEAQVILFLSKDTLTKWAEERDLVLGAFSNMSYAYTASVDFEGRETYFLMYLPPNCTEDALAHEAVHCAWYILDYYGVEVTPGNHEALTYLVGHVVREVRAAIKGWRQAKKENP